VLEEAAAAGQAAAAVRNMERNLRMDQEREYHEAEAADAARERRIQEEVNQVRALL